MNTPTTSDSDCPGPAVSSFYSFSFFQGGLLLDGAKGPVVGWGGIRAGGLVVECGASDAQVMLIVVPSGWLVLVWSGFLFFRSPPGRAGDCVGAGKSGRQKEPREP